MAIIGHTSSRISPDIDLLPINDLFCKGDVQSNDDYESNDTESFMIESSNFVAPTKNLADRLI